MGVAYVGEGFRLLFPPMNPFLLKCIKIRPSSMEKSPKSKTPRHFRYALGNANSCFNLIAY